MFRGEGFFHVLSPSWLPFDKDVYTSLCITISNSQFQQVVDIFATNQGREDITDASQVDLLDEGDCPKNISKPSADQPDSKVAGKSDTKLVITQRMRTIKLMQIYFY